MSACTVCGAAVTLDPDMCSAHWDKWIASPERHRAFTGPLLQRQTHVADFVHRVRAEERNAASVSPDDRMEP